MAMNSPLFFLGKGKEYAGKMKLIVGIHPNALAYSMTTLGAGMMNSIFNFYYVKLFLNRYKISEVAFHQAQVQEIPIPISTLLLLVCVASQMALQKLIRGCKPVAPEMAEYI